MVVALSRFVCEFEQQVRVAAFTSISSAEKLLAPDGAEQRAAARRRYATSPQQVARARLQATDALRLQLASFLPASSRNLGDAANNAGGAPKSACGDSGLDTSSIGAVGILNSKGHPPRVAEVYTSAWAAMLQLATDAHPPTAALALRLVHALLEPVLETDTQPSALKEDSSDMHRSAAFKILVCLLLRVSAF